ncbi:MAG: hypothetical protein K2H58_05195, partial [Paramuribaculum sp.]|nr:hypothetical protein [Paramuribaculum sp.]
HHRALPPRGRRPRPLCIRALMMLYFMHANEAAFLGGITGAIFGSIVGIINNIRFRRYIREIRNELSMALSTE